MAGAGSRAACLEGAIACERGRVVRMAGRISQPELLDLLALCSASTLNALPNTGAASDANAFAEAVGLDMADWWEPTALGFLNHVSKSQIADALKEAGTELAADEIGVLKKDTLVVRAASQLAGKRWLPLPLRRPPG